MKRTLYLKIVPKHLVEQMWGVEVFIYNTNVMKINKDGIPHVVVRCNKKGIVNWESTGVYTLDELVGKTIQFVKQTQK